MARPDWMAKNRYLDSIRTQGYPHDDMWQIHDKQTAGRHFDEGCLTEARKLMEYFDKSCPGHDTSNGLFRDYREIPKRCCEKCWQQLKEEG